jgi:AcrR family transcriptional regulator
MTTEQALPRRGAAAVPRGETAVRRIAADEREHMIAREAVHFFAEHGFEGQTRALAARIGITQPLLYHYFPNKAALIDRVYHEVFLDRLDPQWLGWIGDRSVSLEARLTRYYQAYARVILSYEWVRLFMFSSLKGLDFASRYAQLVMARLYPRVIAEVRHDCGGATLAQRAMTEAETEHLWALHASILYLGIRRWVYRVPVPADQDAAVAARVVAYLEGAPTAMRRDSPASTGRIRMLLDDASA